MIWPASSELLRDLGTPVLLESFCCSLNSLDSPQKLQCLLVNDRDTHGNLSHALQTHMSAGNIANIHSICRDAHLSRRFSRLFLGGLRCFGGLGLRAWWPLRLWLTERGERPRASLVLGDGMRRRSSEWRSDADA